MGIRGEGLGARGEKEVGVFVAGGNYRLFKLQGALWRGLEVEGQPCRFVPAGSTAEVEEMEESKPVTIIADWAQGYYHEEMVVLCVQVQAGKWHPAMPGYQYVSAEALEDFTAAGQVGQMRWEAADGVMVEESVRTPYTPDIEEGDQDIGLLWSDNDLEWHAVLAECD